MASGQCGPDTQRGVPAARRTAAAVVALAAALGAAALAVGTQGQYGATARIGPGSAGASLATAAPENIEHADWIGPGLAA